MRKVKIKFIVTKSGAQRALYFGRAIRWLPLTVEKAKERIANGTAELVGG